jgi:shikimate kinase
MAESKKKNIAIMGFKCCGKSSVAKVMAKKMKKEFVELDDLIIALHEKGSGEKLGFREIHKKYGAEYFRSLEARAVEQLPEKKDCVIALGGGTVAYSANIDLLKSCCTLIYLRDSPERLLQRIRRSGVPAFLDPNDLEGSMKRELARRELLYEKSADITIDCTNSAIPEIVEKILEQLQ